MNKEALKPVALEPDKAVQDFIEKVETELSALLAKFPGSPEEYARHRFHETQSPVQMLAEKVRDVASLAWAFQRFPVFDLGVLTSMRRQTFMRDMGYPREKKKVELFVPNLYWVDARYTMDKASWNPSRKAVSSFSGTPNSWQFPGIGAINYNNEAINMNDTALGMETWESISCPVPHIPIVVRARISKLCSLFDSVTMIFEASWDPEMKKDPFIVGMLGKTAFLLDQFDISVYEKYILSEHVTKRV